MCFMMPLPSGGIVGTLDDMLAMAEATLSDARKQVMKDHHNYVLLRLGMMGTW